MQSDVVEMKETEIGDIPQDWDVLRIIEACDTTAGGTPSRKKPEYFEGGIHWFKSGELNDGLIDYSEEKISELAIDESSAKLFPKGTLLIAMYGATAGKTAKLGVDAATNQAICAIFPDEAKLNRDFLQYNLIYSRNELLKNRHGGAQPNLNQGMIKNHPIPLPSLPEQQKTASILSTTRNAIEQTGAVIQATRELKKSMMKHLFTYEPVPVDQTDQVELVETDIGDINSDWSIGTLEDHTETRYGYTESAKEENIGPKYLRITDISDEGFINWHSVPFCEINEKDLEKYNVKPGDIYVARIGATTGKTCYIEKERNAVFASYLIRLKVLDNDQLIPEYLYRYTQSKLYWDQLNAQKDGKLKKGISASALSSFKIPIPTLDTQKNIARRINIIENKLVNEINKKKSLEILFNSLLENLMTAKIRVV